MKTNVVYGRNVYVYVLIWNIAGSSTRDRNFVYLSTRSAALHSWKDIQFISPWKIHRSSISTYERTY